MSTAMNTMRTLLFFLVIGSVCVLSSCSSCFGAWRVSIRADDQAECLRQAVYRARHRITGHVGRTIGRFEGVGWSSGGRAGTCEPRRFMTLTGDVTVVVGRMQYRVRSWR